MNPVLIRRIESEIRSAKVAIENAERLLKYLKESAEKYETNVPE